jgi:hypothetical protein
MNTHDTDDVRAVATYLANAATMLARAVRDVDNPVAAERVRVVLELVDGKGGAVVNVERLKNTRAAIGRHLARVEADLRRADGLHGRRREAVLRGAARQFMQAGFHDLAKDIRRQSREVRA